MPGLVDFTSLHLARIESIARGAWTNFFWDPESTNNLCVSLQAWASERPGDPFLSFEGRHWTIGAFDAEVNRHARAYRELGLETGQAVALVLENRPAFLFHFYALAKIGVVASLINPALTGPALRHALSVCKPAAIVLGDAQLPALRELLAGGDGGGGEELPVADERVFIDVELDADARARVDWDALADELGFACWNPRVSGCLPLQIAEADLHALSEVVAYIYTSGTTGLPKPAVVKHHRLRRAAEVFGGVSRATGQDCVYCCLPLYHASGTIIAVPLAIAKRARLALARRFSASRFWDECRAEGATIFAYIGELCRYLHNQPRGPGDQDHEVRCMIGNGLREDIWAEFCERFAIERVVEFYGATEGNAETTNLFNLTGTVGPMLPWKMALAAWDPDRGELRRDGAGFCVKAEAGEPGVLLGKIDDKNPYAGYTDKGASSSKVLRDVFEAGDAWFDTGDLLRRDKLWHLHFVDRLGDTFRWKGENVSTQEVAELLNLAPGIKESNVYGVEIPGMEGRAGMAAVVVDEDFDPASFYEHLSAEVPVYAQPRFLRLVESMGTTGTFKHKKVDLREQGWDPAAVDDRLLLRDAKARSYVELTPERRAAVLAGEWPV